jgi:hypothetical protein
LEKIMNFERAISLVIILLFSCSAVRGQQVFDRKVTSTGNIGISITNVGTIGKPDVGSNPGGDPSMEYPLNSGQEHLFEAGLWIGAYTSGSQLRVSTAAVTNSSGYSTGKAGFEFTNDGTPVEERSSLLDSPLFSPLAVSHQDLIAYFSDKRVSIETEKGSVPIRNHDNPLFADVRLESYNWNFSFTESFSILHYTITNNSDQEWDSVYVGMYADLVDRNVNSSIETGSNFYNKNGVGYLDSLYTTYVFDAGSTDNPSLNTYGAISIIGAKYDNNFYHLSNKKYLESKGLKAPSVGPSYWLFSSGAGDFRAPADDQDRYNRMSHPFPIDAYREKLRTDGTTSSGNYISFMSIGPFSKIAPGQSFDVYFAFTGALKPDEYQGLGTIGGKTKKEIDNDRTRVNLLKNLSWVYRTFYGEDKNGNGVLDPGEDINKNGKLDRYLIPEPPRSPKIHVEVGAGNASIYWDKRSESSIDPVSGEKDFEGYRVYRSNLGDDINGKITSRAQVIAEYDSVGNSIGYNTGFNDIALAKPVTFEGDTTKYWYKYDVDDLLSGWQYQFSVTAFDGGNSTYKVQSLESSPNVNAVRVIPGTTAASGTGNSESAKVGVYPNPYRVNAAWDGNNTLTRKIIFYNLPAKAEIRVYTLAGEIVADLKHDSATYKGDIRWFNDFSSDNRVMSGGEHAWDLLSESRQNLSTGLYLYTVKDLETGKVQRGKLAIIK